MTVEPHDPNPLAYLFMFVFMAVLLLYMKWWVRMERRARENRERGEELIQRFKESDDMGEMTMLSHEIDKTWWR